MFPTYWVRCSPTGRGPFSQGSLSERWLALLGSFPETCRSGSRIRTGRNVDPFRGVEGGSGWAPSLMGPDNPGLAAKIVKTSIWACRARWIAIRRQFAVVPGVVSWAGPLEKRRHRGSLARDSGGAP